MSHNGNYCNEKIYSVNLVVSRLVVIALLKNCFWLLLLVGRY